MNLKDDLSERYDIPGHLLTADTPESLQEQAQALSTWKDDAPTSTFARTGNVSGNGTAKMNRTEYIHSIMGEWLGGKE